MFGKDVVEAVESKLKELKMPKGEFYKKSGISSATFSQWRTGINEPSTESLARIEECIGLSFEISKKESAPSVNADTRDTVSDQRLIRWFRSLPEEKQKAILISQDAPEDLL